MSSALVHGVLVATLHEEGLALVPARRGRMPRSAARCLLLPRSSPLARRCAKCAGGVQLHDSLAKAPPSALNARRESDDSADGDSDDAFSVASSGAAKGGGARRRGYRRGRRRAATPPPHAPAHIHVSANAEHTAKTAPTPAFLAASGYFSFFDFFVLRAPPLAPTSTRMMSSACCLQPSGISRVA